MSEWFNTHPCTLDLEIFRAECELTTTRSSGPGGQHRNKTESAVVLKHRPTGVTGQAAERRRQPENLAKALSRLRVNLALEVRCEPAGEHAPSALWRRRCVAGKIVVNPEHQDFATLLAEALDVLTYRHAHLQHAAEQLGCTPTQLGKLLRHEPRAWQLFNQWRRQHHLPPLS